MGGHLPWPFGGLPASTATNISSSAARRASDSELLRLLLQGGGGGGEMLLALAPLGGGDPGALDVRGALEAPALAAGPASHVGAVLLCLVAAVLAAHPPSSAVPQADGALDRSARLERLIGEREEPGGGGNVELLLLLLRLLPMDLLLVLLP